MKELRTQPWIAMALAMVVTVCPASESAQSAAKELKKQLTGADKDAVACKLLSRDEIAKALGAAVEVGETSGPLGSACSWKIKSQDRTVMLQFVPRKYYEDGARQPGGEALAGIGEKAFVGPWLDDQRAGALTANGAVYVMTPKKDASVALLRAVATRVPPQ